MASKFIPDLFEKVDELADILQIAQMLGLNTHRYGNSGQVRCPCPVHSGGTDTLCISPHVRSKRGSLGVFFCQQEKKGGDRIGLVAHCEGLGQQDAAHYIASQFGMDIEDDDDTDDSTARNNSSATVPPAQQKAPQKAAPKPPADFDPQAFAAKLVFSEEVAALGFSEEDAEHFGVGFYQGKVYAPLRHPSGDIACFYDYRNGRLKLPARARWLEQSAPNVIPFGKKTA
jgi:hypothetical protein